MNARTTILGFSLLLGLGSTAALASDLVVNGSFSAGNTGFSTGYTLTTQTPQLFENCLHGIYAVIPIGNVAPQSAYNDWVNVTVDPSGGNGNVYVADGATTYPTTVWQETLAVAPGSGYLFSYDAAEISNTCCSNADFQVAVNGVVLGDQTVGDSWVPYSYSWNSGLSTTATITLTDLDNSGSFNDFVLDDLSFDGPSPSTVTPEPSSMLLLGSGLVSLAGLMRRKIGMRG